ncbi:MAG: PIN domain-containing protein [Trueperaceae bacterium]|nr:MAG: PIN domain-containing protein [Trueperaceae bacterium]
MSAKLAEGTRAFVDTNILLYAFDTSAGKKRSQALDLFQKLWRTGNGCISVQVLQEFFVNATRKLPKPLALEIAERIVASLSRWEVHAPNAEDVLSAIDLQQATQLSFWDAMVVYSAASLGCNVLYSEDFNAGQTIAGIEIINPFET